MNNWKTTLAGIGAGAMNLWASGGFAANWKQFVVSAGLAALGILAKDHSAPSQ